MNQPYQARYPYREFSPARPNYSLSVDDITGAKPRIGPNTKNTYHYEQKLAYQNPIFAENQNVYEQMYNTGKYHAGSAQLPSQKKHFNAHHDSEINAQNVLKRNEAVPVQIHNVEFPRNLTTDDIPGTKPGSLQSKTVKNHDLANKMREGQAIQDSLDRFQQEKRHSSPYAHNYHNLYSNAPLGNNYHYVEEKREPTPQKPTPQLHEDYIPRRQNSGNGLRSISAHPVPQQEETYSPQLNYPYPEQGRMSEVPMQRQSEHGYSAQYAPKKIEESYQPAHQNIFSKPQNPVSSSHDHFPLSQKEIVSNLSQDIIAKQAALEKKMYDAVKARSYNIISGYPSQFHGQRNSYGATIQSMRKNNEQFPKQEPVTLRSWNPSQQQQHIPPTISNSNVDLRRDPVDNAGKLNDYAETNYRYANKIPGQAPLQDSQMYGAKALKNLSGMRLY